MAIRIKTKKAPVGYDPGASKFFGTPTIPKEWLETFGEDERDFSAVTLHREFY